MLNDDIAATARFGELNLRAADRPGHLPHEPPTQCRIWCHARRRAAAHRTRTRRELRAAASRRCPVDPGHQRHASGPTPASQKFGQALMLTRPSVPTRSAAPGSAVKQTSVKRRAHEDPAAAAGGPRRRAWRAERGRMRGFVPRNAGDGEDLVAEARGVRPYPGREAEISARDASSIRTRSLLRSARPEVDRGPTCRRGASVRDGLAQSSTGRLEARTQGAEASAVGCTAPYPPARTNSRPDRTSIRRRSTSRVSTIGP
jgi:hypothetical protein